MVGKRSKWTGKADKVGPRLAQEGCAAQMLFPFLGSSWWAALPNFFEVSLPWALSRTPRILHVNLEGRAFGTHISPPFTFSALSPSWTVALLCSGWRDISHWCLSVTSIALEGSVGQKDAWIQDK